MDSLIVTRYSKQYTASCQPYERQTLAMIHPSMFDNDWSDELLFLATATDADSQRFHLANLRVDLADPKYGKDVQNIAQWVYDPDRELRRAVVTAICTTHKIRSFGWVAFEAWTSALEYDDPLPLANALSDAIAWEPVVNLALVAAIIQPLLDVTAPGYVPGDTNIDPNVQRELFCRYGVWIVKALGRRIGIECGSELAVDWRDVAAILTAYSTLRSL